MKKSDEKAWNLQWQKQLRHQSEAARLGITSRQVARRETKRLWIAKKRQELKDSQPPRKVVVDLPLELALRLHEVKPLGKPWGLYLVELIAAGVGTPVPEPVKPGRSLNAKCPCGSGRKWKKCCGRLK